MRFLFIPLIFLTLSVFAQPANKKITRQEYIERYKDDAILEMQNHGIPASITLAQGILESGDGNSTLARKANNHFGIKCHSDWNGPTFIQDDDAKNECFRKYKDPYESYKDHSDFLKRKRYAALFELKTTDYKGWAHGLKKAGYATNPKYPQLLIKIIEENNLSQYDTKTSKKNSKNANKKDSPKSIPSSTNKNARHKVQISDNLIKYVDFREGDDIESIAEEFQMGLWQFYKYNDLEKGKSFPPGYKLYLQPKRGKAKEEYHIVLRGETMWHISQIHGVKLKKLYKKNGMLEGDVPKAGEKIYLRSKKPS